MGGRVVNILLAGICEAISNLGVMIANFSWVFKVLRSSSASNFPGETRFVFKGFFHGSSDYFRGADDFQGD